MPLFLGDTARIPDPTLVPGPTVSLLHVTTPEDFLALPYKTQQEMFRHRCILFDQVKVTDGPPVSFDVQGLRQYREIGSEVDIQDSFAREENQVHRVFKTPLSTLLDPDRQGLNALSIDMSGRTIPAPPAYRSLATHEPAILGVPGHSAGELPSGPLRWAQFSKKHSFTFQHVDVAATYFQCLVGPKIFFLGIQGPVLYPGRGDWSSRRMFSAWNPLEANTEVFATEMICLRPDQILYMQPQTPHAVITIDNSVAIGGHLITSATIQRAVCGTLINAMNQDAAINVRDSVTRFLLLRVFSLQVGRILDGQGDSEHVPDLTTADGVLDLLFLHHLVAIYLAVDPSSYKNPDPEFPMTQARLREVSYIRSLSKPLVQYIDSNFVFESTQPTLSSFLDATALSLRHMALCLLVFKCEQGASKNFTADALRDRLVKDLTSFADLHAHPDLPRPTDGLVKAFREKAAQEHDTESAFVHFMPWDAQTLPFTLTRREQLKRRNESPSNGRKRARRSNE
ncbi:hypothetical protein B0H11DRAFT_2017657 [Mycena galericulata]|nr:hypothetical protein B0H11DRAFT_2017657 [Mycena galericulata]